MRRLALLLPLLAAASGCGGDESDEPRSIAAVKECLEGKGLQTVGGAAEPSPGDDDAPDRGELITAGAFIAFYSSEARADELAKGVEENSERINATVARKGDVTIFYTDTSKQAEIEACLT